MSTAIFVHPDFDGDWPFAADHLHDLVASRGAVHFVRLPASQKEVADFPPDAAAVTRIIVLRAGINSTWLAGFPNLREAYLDLYDSRAEAAGKALEARRVKRLLLQTESFWGQSVAEFALGLTLAALRRIPQTHQEIRTSLAAWDYTPKAPGAPGRRGHQFGDDPNFASGTIAGKRVRIVGAGNIGSRFASWCHMLGADVAAWDAVAPDPCFHRTGARRITSIDKLVRDAEIFAPMLPLRPATEGIIKAHHIDALPKGCLVLLVTRAEIVDMPALRRRVLDDELSLAADVFDAEPLPLNDPLLGRHNVIHTPHNAGRTIHSNQQIAESIAGLFED